MASFWPWPPPWWRSCPLAFPSLRPGAGTERGARLASGAQGFLERRWVEEHVGTQRMAVQPGRRSSLRILRLVRLLPAQHPLLIAGRLHTRDELRSREPDPSTETQEVLRREPSGSLRWLCRKERLAELVEATGLCGE